MRTAPDRVGAKKTNAEQAHENRRHARPREDGAVLLVVINHKQADHQQPGQPTANNAQWHRQNGKSSGNGYCKQESRGQNVPPAFPGIIPCISFSPGVKSMGLGHSLVQRLRDCAHNSNKVYQLFLAPGFSRARIRWWRPSDSRRQPRAIPRRVRDPD